jgi:glycerophosphoryl diester phosphodiesterase
LLNDTFGPGETPSRQLANILPRLSIPVLAIGTAIAVGFGVIFGAVLLDRIESDGTVLIVAHRGSAGARPENTVASIEQAVEDGADWVEIDVQETADGQVVVVHDSDFMKLAGVDIKVWDATMEDLAEIDIGSWFDPQFADQRTPTLANALEIVRDRSRLLIELKYYGHNEELESRVVDIVETAEMQDQVATMSLKYPLVQTMKTLRPDWPAGVLAATSVGDLTGLEGDFIAVSAAQATSRLVRATRSADKKLLVWTVNDPVQMSAMITLGVDGLITDEPALAKAVLQQRAEMNVAEKMALFLVDRLGLTVNSEEYRDASP